MRKWLTTISLALTCSFASSSDILISADEAYKLIGKENVVFVNGDSEDVFELGHIKGSVSMYAHHLHHADITGDMHCKPLFMCPDEAEEYIGSKGISNDTLVIAYDDFRGPNATGVYAYFKSFGHTNLKILDGGRWQIKMLDPVQKTYDAVKKEAKVIKKKLKRAKKAEVKDEALIAQLKSEYKAKKAELKKISKSLIITKGRGEKPKKAHYEIDETKIDYDYIASKDEMLTAVRDILKNGKDSKYIIIDSRGFTEIIGERKLDNVARGGHIAGATLLEWKNFTDFDKKLSFKSKEAMQKILDERGITKDKTIYAYCHVGAGRSSDIITALEMLDYPNIKVYTGSYDEWGNDMDLPIRR